MLEIYPFGTRSSWCTLLLPWAVGTGNSLLIFNVILKDLVENVLV